MGDIPTVKEFLCQYDNETLKIILEDECNSMSANCAAVFRGTINKILTERG